MKYTRFEFNSCGDRKFRHFILRFAVIIMAAGLITGYIISEFILVPYVFKIDGQEMVVPKKAVPAYKFKEIKHRKYYTVQVGVFKSFDNAGVLAGRMRSSGIPAYLKREENYTRIIVYVRDDKNMVDKRVSSLKSIGYSSIVKELDISVKDIPQEFKRDKGYILLSILLNSIGDEIDKYCSVLAKYEYSPPVGDILNEVKAINEDIIQQIDSLKAAEGAESHIFSGVLNDMNNVHALLVRVPDSVLQSEEAAIQLVYILENMTEYYNSL